MNLKNKILLTALALLLSICIFNTDCFAFEVSDDTYGTFNIPDEVQDYYYILYGYDVDNNNKVDWYCFAVSTKPIVYGSYKPSDVNNRYAFYTDGNILASVVLSGSTESFQAKLDELTLNTSSTSTGYFQGGSEDIFYGTYYKLLFSFNNHDIVDKQTESILKEANVEKIERGTEEGDTTDNTIGGTESDSENTTDSDDSGGILSSITQGFKNVVDFFKELIGFVGNILSYLNPFSDNFILKGVLEFLGNILSYLNPFNENFLGFKLIDLLQSLFEFLFIPEENSFTGIKDIVVSKFDFIETIKSSANSLKDLISNVGTAPKLSINVNNNKYGVKEVTLIDLEWYKPYKTYGDLILTGFIYAFFLWRLFISIPNIIYGAAGSVHNGFNIKKGIEIDMSDFNKNFKL